LMRWVSSFGAGWALRTGAGLRGGILKGGSSPNVVRVRFTIDIANPVATS
jgi:hypothetical protein